LHNFGKISEPGSTGFGSNCFESGLDWIHSGNWSLQSGSAILTSSASEIAILASPVSVTISTTTIIVIAIPTKLIQSTLWVKNHLAFSHYY
jgi:hypothetical protein